DRCAVRRGSRHGNVIPNPVPGIAIMAVVFLADKFASAGGGAFKVHQQRAQLISLRVGQRAQQESVEHAEHSRSQSETKRHSRHQATAAARPIANPVAQSRAPLASTIRSTSSGRAPSATRTPISRVGWVTANDNTA